MTKVTTKISRKGNEFTVVEVEDFTGKAEIALFGRNHTAHKDKFRQGEPVVIKLNYTASKFNPERVDMNIEEVSPLESIRGKMANAVMVFMDLHYKNQDFFSRISQIEDKSRPGDLYIELIDTQTRQTMRVHSRKKFPINRETMTLIEESGLRFKVMDGN